MSSLNRDMMTEWDYSDGEASSMEDMSEEDMKQESTSSSSSSSCWTAAATTLQNTIRYGNYEPNVSFQDMLEVKEETKACMLKHGTDSDFMLIASMLLQQVSTTDRHNQTLKQLNHLGMIYLHYSTPSPGQPEPALDMVQHLRQMLTETLIKPYQGKNSTNQLFSLNVHLYYEPKDFFHEATIVVDGSTGQLEYWDSSRPVVFSPFYRLIRKGALQDLFGDVIVLPKKSAQIRPSSCGFWSLWYLQKRMQGCPPLEINKWFNSPKTAKKIRKEIEPRMSLMAAAVVECWQRTMPTVQFLPIEEMQTPQQKQAADQLITLICQCADLDVLSALPDQWEKFCQAVAR